MGEIKLSWEGTQNKTYLKKLTLPDARLRKMLKLFIGSSNIYRFYKPEVFKEYDMYKMIRCPNEKVFKVSMEGIVMEKGEVILSVIENFLANVVAGCNDRDSMNKALEKRSESIGVNLLSSLHWFTQCFDYSISGIQTALTSLVNKLEMD